MWMRVAWVAFNEIVGALEPWFRLTLQGSLPRVQNPQEKEAMQMTIAKAPARAVRLEATPSGPQLKAATHKAASAETKAKQAKAALKKARKAFKAARKTAKAARREAKALQEAISRSEEQASAAAKAARAARRAPRKKPSRPSATSQPRPPVTPRAVRKTFEAALSTLPREEFSHTEAVSNPTAAVDGARAAKAERHADSAGGS